MTRDWLKLFWVWVLSPPVCHQVSTGTFPEEVKAPVQYGPRVQTLAVYLSQYQLLSLQRTSETMADLCQAPISQAVLRHWIVEAASTLTPTLKSISTLLMRSKLLHVDETSVHLGGKVHWAHEHGTHWLTLYCWHRKRGAEGIEAVSLIPQYRERMMHDRWSSYDCYPCTHSLCGAHLIRDTIFVAEHEKQPWAARLVEHLRQMLHVTNDWRARGAQLLPSELRRELLAEYFEIVRTGYAAHAARPMPPPVSKGGRKKQNPSLNLLDTFLKRAEQILGLWRILSPTI